MLSLVQFTYSPPNNISYCWYLTKDRWFLSTFQINSPIPEILDFWKSNSSHSIFLSYSQVMTNRKIHPLILTLKVELFPENAGENIVYHYWTAPAQIHIPLNSFVAWQNVKHIVAINHEIYPMQSNRAPYHIHSHLDMSIIWTCALPSQNEYQGFSHLYLCKSLGMLFGKNSPVASHDLISTDLDFSFVLFVVRVFILTLLFYTFCFVAAKKNSTLNHPHIWWKFIYQLLTRYSEKSTFKSYSFLSFVWCERTKKIIVWILSLYFIDVNRNVHVNKRLLDYLGKIGHCVQWFATNSICSLFFFLSLILVCCSGVDKQLTLSRKKIECLWQMGWSPKW